MSDSQQKRTAVETGNAPAALGPYSQAVVVHDMLMFVSGQVPVDPATGKLAYGGVEAQTEQSCRNVAAILASRGASMADVVKTTVFIADMADFPKVNEVYKKHFPAPCPARSCVEVSALPLGALVEIEAIAILK